MSQGNTKIPRLELLSQLIISFSALALLQFIGTGPVEMRARFVKRMDWFKFLLNNTREELRETVASIYSLVGASIPRPDFEKAVKDLTRYVQSVQCVQCVQLST